ncbi:hypothetical protein J421_0178 [Gemmatirosa kalamazoonensis]|uniref:Tat (Twin-arginine translocation) pathway signal sequence n=1 Tax=Gemmatirosa kalamazoonensis TaxID=861299 RepID=W0RBM9_9BACT|nr:hypothetical protein [Gemmatirosa kalamazoonensis]AHG87715.1 hypothetical protein J421_0178 [Gemmatirosa kalamazoonensis]
MPHARSRRDFLASLAATAAAVPLAGLAAPAGAAAPAPFDDAWTARVAAAKHKAVFDGPDPTDGLALTQSWIYRRGYEAMGAAPRDVVPVVVLRHAAAVVAADDALWAKYPIGALRKIDDPDTRKPAERNPWARTPVGKPTGVEDMLGPGTDPTVEGVIRSGGIVLVCNLALANSSRAIAKQRGLKADDVLAELRAGLIPGVILQPSGVYATARAQEVGAVFMRST